MSRRRLLLIGAAILVIAIAAVFLRRSSGDGIAVEIAAVQRQATFRSVVTGSGEIVASRYAEIGAEVMGRIVDLPVAEGQQVRAGQILARIDPVAATSDAAAAAALVRALEAEVRASAEQIRAAEADVAGAEARERDARQLLARRRELSEARLIAASDFDSAENAAQAAVAQLATARASLERLRQAETAAGARLAQARAQQLRASDTLKKTDVVAPIDGVVTRLRVRAGEMVVIGIQNQPGTTLMTVSDLTQVNAEVKVAEADVLRVALRQGAEVTLDAVPGRRFAGQVIEVGASALPATTGAASRDFRVVIRLAAPDASLRPGLTCDADIVTSEQRDVLTVPLQAIVLRPPHAGGEATAGVFTLEGNRVRFTPVTRGAIGGMDTTITGVPEGTSVVIGPFQALRELQDGDVVRAAAPPAARAS